MGQIIKLLYCNFGQTRLVVFSFSQLERLDLEPLCLLMADLSWELSIIIKDRSFMQYFFLSGFELKPSVTAKPSFFVWDECQQCQFFDSLFTLIMFRHFLDVLVVPLLQPAAAATITICCPIDLCKCSSILSTMTLFFDWTNNYDWLLQHALGRNCPLHLWPENNISCNDWAEIMIDYREQKHKHYHSFYYYAVCHFRSIERQRETKWKYVTGQPKNSSQNVC